MFFIKFFISFIISFVILCFPLNNKPLFSYLHEMSFPYTNQLFSLSVNKENIKKLFLNSNPNKDSISKKNSSSKKVDLQDQQMSDHEKALLNKYLP